MANQRRGLASESIFQRISTAVQARVVMVFSLCQLCYLFPSGIIVSPV